jgi:hypothetical protein
MLVVLATSKTEARGSVELKSSRPTCANIERLSQNKTEQDKQLYLFFSFSILDSIED